MLMLNVSIDLYVWEKDVHLKACVCVCAYIQDHVHTLS